MTDIRFWYATGSCALAAHILLEEVGAAFDGIRIPMSPVGGAFPDGFEAINPKMRVPVLSIDGQVITEVPALATAISAMAPQKHLMGRDPLEAARILEWMVWLSGTLHGQGFGGLWRPYRFTDDEGAHAGIQAKAMRTIRDCFATIESRIGEPFATGRAFTAVDAYLFVFGRWGNLVGIDVDAEFPRYAALCERLSGHPSVAATVANEGIDPLGKAAA